METAPSDVHAAASSSQVRLRAPVPSFGEVYREYFVFVWSTLRRLGVAPAALEDATQDVFVVVHRRLPDFEGRGAGLRSWLFTIVRRVAFRHRRGAQRSERKHRALAQVRAEVQTMDEALDQRTVTTLLLAALDELDDDKRIALDLHVFEGLSGPQIAQALEINVDTAYSRIKAARRRLQRSLDAAGLRTTPERLVTAVRRETRPPKGARRKVAAALVLRLDTGAAITTAAGFKAVLLGVALGGVAAVGVGVEVGGPAQPQAEVGAPAKEPGRSRSRRARRSAPTSDDVSPVSPPDSPVPVSSGVPVDPQAPTDSGGQPRAVGRHPSGSADSAEARLAAEVELITAAKRALAHEPARALELLSTHATRFADGQLQTERAGYRAIALCALGRTVQGRGEARLFVAAHPRSSLADRVRRACEISSPSP